MTALSVAPYLVEFVADGAAGRRAAAAVCLLQDGIDHEPVPDQPSPTEQSYAEGFGSGQAAANAACEARLEQQKAAFEAQLAAERQAWVAQQGETLARTLVAAIKDLEARIAETAARILRPFLTEQLRLQMISELCASLDTLLTKDPELGLTVSGPEDLLAALRAQLEDKTGAVTYVANTDCDVRVMAGQTLLETRLKAWIASIEEACR